ncbi:unnamed protein product [Psylliodes chrysocephalus]|uniref:Uncharacterized protein n=1 Tax=Psylliodes chrysocephalus TaxID=3402493 RepID=A0A9P0DEC5_9CUCU|nr:unnamed protein product [Psylliodes chrysocephala]
MKRSIEAEINKKTLENNIHKRKAEVFYQRKKLARKQAMKQVDFECIAMDFQKNLPMPNLSTNEIYYKRQLTLHSFNIHVLSTNSATFYCYPEIIGRKGSNDVASLLHYFIFVQLSSKVRHLRIFCDSCGGQNKNFTVFRYLHYVVHVVKRLDTIQVIFPVRGYSYMECDRDMALINQKIPAELPEDWFNKIKSCRVKPEPFTVIEVDQALLRNWTELLDLIYITKHSYKSREIREVKISQEQPRLIEFRNTYNGCWNTSIIRKHIVASKNTITPKLPDGQFVLPHKLYFDLKPISAGKYRDLMDLKELCSTEKAINYYGNLPHSYTLRIMPKANDKKPCKKGKEGDEKLKKRREEKKLSMRRAREKLKSDPVKHEEDYNIII